MVHQTAPVSAAEIQNPRHHAQLHSWLSHWPAGVVMALMRPCRGSVMVSMARSRQMRNADSPMMTIQMARFMVWPSRFVGGVCRRVWGCECRVCRGRSCFLRFRGARGSACAASGLPVAVRWGAGGRMGRRVCRGFRRGRAG